MEILPSQIKLIGSAKTGFSISNPPNYGKAFGKKSDLDFSIINENIFLTLRDEFESWGEEYKSGSLLPKTEREKTTWANNYFEVPKYQISRGLIDTYKIPNLTQFPTAQKVNNALSLIVINLRNRYSIEVKGASVRVYRSWTTFTQQLQLNTEKILSKAK